MFGIRILVGCEIHYCVALCCAFTCFLVSFVIYRDGDVRISEDGGGVEGNCGFYYCGKDIGDDDFLISGTKVEFVVFVVQKIEWWRRTRSSRYVVTW